MRPPKPADWDEDGKRKWEEAKLLRARLHRVREAYRRASLSFRVITERGIAKYWGDPDIVDEVIASDRWDVEPEDLNRLVTALAEAGGSLPMWRCEALFAEAPFPRGMVLSRIPERIIRIDLFSLVGPHTIVHMGVVSC